MMIRLRDDPRVCRYVGTQAIQFIRAKGASPSISSIAHSSYMDIFQNLAVDMDTEGRYGAQTKL